MRRYWKKHPVLYKECQYCGDYFEVRQTRRMSCGSASCVKLNRNAADRSFRENIRSHYGTECAICGDDSALEIDHVHGYGKQHKIEIGVIPTSSSAFYRWLRNNNYPNEYTVGGITYKDGFRVLCKGCNNTQPKKRT